MNLSYVKPFTSQCKNSIQLWNKLTGTSFYKRQWENRPCYSYHYFTISHGKPLEMTRHGSRPCCKSFIYHLSMFIDKNVKWFYFLLTIVVAELLNLRRAFKACHSIGVKSHKCESFERFAETQVAAVKKEKQKRKKKHNSLSRYSKGETRKGVVRFIETKSRSGCLISESNIQKFPVLAVVTEGSPSKTHVTPPAPAPPSQTKPSQANPDTHTHTHNKLRGKDTNLGQILAELCFKSSVTTSLKHPCR